MKMPDNARASAQEKQPLLLDGQRATPSYSPDLAPSNCRLFGAMTDALRGKHYSNNEEVKIAVKNWVLKQPPEFLQNWNTCPHSKVE